jgi:hypothetical protein
MALWVISLRTFIFFWGGGGVVTLESESIGIIQRVQHYSVQTTVYNSVSSINLPRHKMGSTNTTCPTLYSDPLCMLLLYTAFSFNYFGNKLSFERKLVKTIFPCPVCLHMEEYKKKTWKMYNLYMSIVHTLQYFLWKESREGYNCDNLFYFCHLVF